MLKVLSVLNLFWVNKGKESNNGIFFYFLKKNFKEESLLSVSYEYSSLFLFLLIKNEKLNNLGFSLKKDKNRIISKKYFYSSFDKLELNNFEELIIDLKKWSINWGFGTDDLILALKIVNKIKNKIQKKVIRRNYSSENFFQHEEFKSNTEIFAGHYHQNGTYIEIESNSDKILYETVYSIQFNGTKTDWTKELTIDLNAKSEEVKKNLTELKNNGNITEVEEKKIWGTGFIKNSDIVIKKNQKISLLSMKNLTTSKKNAISIVEKGKLKDWPVNKGINLHNNSLNFLLEGDESFRRVLWFLILLYRIDIINQEYLLEAAKQQELDIIADNTLKELFERNGDKVNFKDFKKSLEFNSDKETIFGYLINQIRE